MRYSMFWTSFSIIIDMDRLTCPSSIQLRRYCGSILSITLFWRCGREGSMILRMKWDLRVIRHLSFMTHVALKQAEHLSWIKSRSLCKNVQPTNSLRIICMWFGKWLSGNIKVHLNTSCVGTASQSMMKPDQLQGQSGISSMNVGLVEVCKVLIMSWISPFLFMHSSCYCLVYKSGYAWCPHHNTPG